VRTPACSPNLSLLLIVGFLLALTTACSMIFGHGATAPANGLDVAQMEAALPASDGWSSRHFEEISYRERFNHDGLIVATSLESSSGEISVSVYKGSGPESAEESAQWRSQVDEVVSRLEAIHPAIGPWEYDDFTQNWFGWTCLGALAICAVAGVGVFVARRARR